MAKAAAKKSDVEPLVQLLHRASQKADALFGELIKGIGLTPRQFAVLHALGNRGSANQTELTAETGIDRSTMAELVRRLIEQGRVQRKRTEADARAYEIRLTAKGKEDLRRGRTMLRQMEQIVAATFSDKQLSQLRAQLDHFTDAPLGKSGK